MNLVEDKIVHLLTGKHNLFEVSVDELQAISDEQPFFSVAQLLLTQKMKQVNHPGFVQQLQKTALFFPNIFWLDKHLQESQVSSYPSTNTVTTTTAPSFPSYSDPKPSYYNAPDPAPPAAVTETVTPAPAPSYYSAAQQDDDADLNPIAAQYGKKPVVAAEKAPEQDIPLWMQSFEDSSSDGPQATATASPAEETAPAASPWQQSFAPKPEAAVTPPVQETKKEEIPLWMQSFEDSTAVEAEATGTTTTPVPAPVQETPKEEIPLWMQSFEDSSAAETTSETTGGTTPVENNIAEQPAAEKIIPFWEQPAAPAPGPEAIAPTPAAPVQETPKEEIPLWMQSFEDSSAVDTEPGATPVENSITEQPDGERATSFWEQPAAPAPEAVAPAAPVQETPKEEIPLWMQSFEDSSAADTATTVAAPEAIAEQQPAAEPVADSWNYTPAPIEQVGTDTPESIEVIATPVEAPYVAPEPEAAATPPVEDATIEQEAPATMIVADTQEQAAEYEHSIKESFAATIQEAPPVDEDELPVDAIGEANDAGHIPNMRLAEMMQQQADSFNKPLAENATLAIEGEPYHTIDYFASQGIKAAEAAAEDSMAKKVRKFTDWLKQMKKVNNHLSDLGTDAELEQVVHGIAATSIESKEIVTEAMADVLVKQGKIDKAVLLYSKLSFLNPTKTAYFAAKILELKGN